jgi:hypothetical protein
MTRCTLEFGSVFGQQPACRTRAELVEKWRAAGQVPFARPKRFEALSAGVMVYSRSDYRQGQAGM